MSQAWGLVGKLAEALEIWVQEVLQEDLETWVQEVHLRAWHQVWGWWQLDWVRLVPIAIY